MAFGTDTVVSRKLKKAQEQQAAEHQELMAAINATNQWLSHLAELLRSIDAKLGQQALAGGVFYQAGAPK